MLQSGRLAHHAPEALMFTAPKGEARCFADTARVDDHNFRNRLWKMVIPQLGNNYRKPYNTCHTMGFHTLDQQMNLVLVAELTGHNVKTLYEHYAGNVNSCSTLVEGRVLR
jgi:integrase